MEAGGTSHLRETVTKRCDIIYASEFNTQQGLVIFGSVIWACIHFHSLISGTRPQRSLTPLIWRKILGSTTKSVNAPHCSKNAKIASPAQRGQRAVSVSGEKCVVYRWNATVKQTIYWGRWVVLTVYSLLVIPRSQLVVMGWLLVVNH